MNGLQQAIREIQKLFGKLPRWMSDALRVLMKSDNIDDSVDPIARLAIQEFEIDPGFEAAAHPYFAGAELPASDVADSSLVWTDVSDVQGVNAIRPGQVLQIGPQLTIIYGENGCGKSGYAKLIKNAFGLKGAEDILGNVYSQKSDPQTATFSFNVNGDAKHEKWEGRPLDSIPKSSFLFYDRKCAEIILGKSNQISFQPGPVRLMDEFGSFLTKIKGHITLLASKIFSEAEDLHDMFNETAVGLAIQGMTAETDFDSIKKSIEWTEADQNILNALRLERAQMGRPREEQKRELNKRLDRAKSLYEHATAVEQAISEDHIVRLKEIPSKLAQLHATEMATSGIIESIEMQGIGSPMWKELVNLAAKFSKEQVYSGKDFPVPPPDGRCVLCWQPLDSAAASRLTEFFRFANAQLAHDISSVEGEQRALIDRVTSLRAEIPLNIASCLGENGVSILTEVQLAGFQKANYERALSIVTAQGNGDWSLPVKSAEIISDVVSEEMESIARSIVELSKDTDLDTKIKTLDHKILELSTKEKASTSLARIQKRFESLVRVKNLEALASSISTAPITRVSKTIGDLLLTDECKANLESEIKLLGTPRIKNTFKIRGDHASLYLEVGVDSKQTAKIDSVFSEGEKSALALSMFFTELKIMPSNVGIVFDDPVSSLDHVIRKKVANRIVEEASQRQVVVLTHDLVFWCEVSEAASELKFNVVNQTILAFESNVGIVESGAPWHGASVNERINVLDRLVKRTREAAETGDYTLFNSLQIEFFGKLRSTWERAVEEVLFRGVVLRRQSEVKTRTLKKEVVIDDELVELVEDGMTETSAQIEAHDHATAENASKPTVEDMRNSVEKIRKFIALQKQKMNEAQTRRGVKS